MQNINNSIPIIFGIESTSLSNNEKDFFKEVKPAGYILFARNISEINQIKKLCAELRIISGENIDVYIDQEGGRVARLKPPIFRPCPPPATFAKLIKNNGLEDALKALYDNYFYITKDLLELGINVNCVPVADLYYPDADIIIGDRSFGSDPEIVTQFCMTVMKAVKEAGGKYIIKHIPGHGRAKVDSHLSLPIIEEKLEILETTDFKVFKNLAQANADMAMTAHIIYHCLDSENPITLSRKAINYIRENLGFKGIIISDDITMKALQGDLTTITQNAKAAGCDLVLHCNGKFEEMVKVANALSN